MTSLLWLFVILLATHWFADFFCQTHWQAMNKSKNNKALLAHVTTYTLILMGVSLVLFNWQTAIVFAVINGIAHFITDYYTSRATSKLWAKGQTHNFFVVVGLDQLIHQTTLAFTLWGMLQ